MFNGSTTVTDATFSALTAEFQETVRRDYARLEAAAMRILRSADLALDAVQDGCLSAWRALPTFRGESRMSTWLHRIVLNAALMRRRATRARREVSLLAESGEPAPAIPIEQAAGMGGADLETAEDAQRLAVALRTLPNSYQEVLSYRVAKNLDTRETGRRMKITPAAVKVRLHRAVRALRSRVRSKAA